jgi:hypothetical protein
MYNKNTKSRVSQVLSRSSSTIIYAGKELNPGSVLQVQQCGAGSLLLNHPNYTNFKSFNKNEFAAFYFKRRNDRYFSPAGNGFA